MNLRELQEWVKNDWEQRSDGMPSVELQLLYIMEELGEVAEAIRKTSGNKNRVVKDVDIGSEIADPIISISTLANHYDVDIDNEIEKFKARLETRHNSQ